MSLLHNVYICCIIQPGSVLKYAAAKKKRDKLVLNLKT